MNQTDEDLQFVDCMACFDHAVRKSGCIYGSYKADENMQWDKDQQKPSPVLGCANILLCGLTYT